MSARIKTFFYTIPQDLPREACSSHADYEAKNEPVCGCLPCWEKYVAARQAKAEREQLNETFLLVHTGGAELSWWERKWRQDKDLMRRRAEERGLALVPHVHPEAA